MHRVRENYSVRRPINVQWATDSGNEWVNLDPDDRIVVINNSSIVVFQYRKDPWKRPLTPVMKVFKIDQGTNAGEIIYELRDKGYITLEAKEEEDD